MRTVPFLMVVVVAGCGSDGPGPGTPLDTGPADEAYGDLETGHDVAPADDGPLMDEGGNEDLSADDGMGEPEPVDPCPGGEGCECVGADDCDNNLCVRTMDKMACATPCADSDECPAGWECGADFGTFDFCKAPLQLCRPCVDDLDCQDGVAFSDFCLEFGPNGRFCATVCSADDPCPEGWECKEKTHGRAILDLCVPAGGAACPCRDDFVEGGFLTVCYVENEHGRCEATRTCDVDCAAQVPAQEKCNGADDDCDGATDEDVGTLLCFETNQFGTCTGVSECIEGSLDNCNAAVPRAEECNLADDDCDGTTDNGIEPLVCEKSNQWGTCKGSVDCMNGAFAQCEVAEPAQEACNGEDDDCDGETDEAGANGCTPYCANIDNDPFGDPLDIQCLCEPKYPYNSTLCADCDDGNFEINPGAAESCNGKDDDCDGTTDEEGAAGCVTYFFDNDGDGYSLTGVDKCLCEPFGKFTAKLLGDCNDTNVLVNPGVAESCNGVDDNCDGSTDEGLPGC